jgi:two-component system phosphate regulon sensor histidine kinase PhoR
VFRSRSLTILIWVLVLGALACAATRVFARTDGLTHLNAYDVLPWTLLVLATAAGLLALASFRRDCADLADALRQQQRDNSISIKRPSSGHLMPLAQAIEECRQNAADSVQQARLHAQELDTRLKLANAERHHAESIIDTLSDAVLVTDLLGDLVVANEAATKTFALDLTGPDRAQADQVLRDPRLMELINEVRRSDVPGIARVTEQRLRTPHGDRMFKITLSAMSGSTNERSGVLAVLHDTTPEKDIAEIKNEFVSGVSHELRTPLASIKAYVEMLIDGEAQDDKTKREFYEVIQNEANRLGRLIDNILNVSRIESGLVRVEQKPQVLRGVIREAIDVIQPQARSKKITIDERLTDISHEAMLDRDLIYQAVLNLLSNAIRYTHEGGMVRVETIVDSERNRITARFIDNGAGIPEADLPLIFNKFHKVEANSVLGQGTGLGLSLVKHVIENAHRGRVSVLSEVGKGSCFEFELDLCRKSPAAIAAEVGAGHE